MFDWLVIVMIAALFGNTPGEPALGMGRWWLLGPAGLGGIVIAAAAMSVLCARAARSGEGRSAARLLFRVMPLFRVAAAAWFVLGTADGWGTQTRGREASAVTLLAGGWPVLAVGVSAAVLLHAAGELYWFIRRPGPTRVATVRTYLRLVWHDIRMRVALPVLLAILLSIWMLVSWAFVDAAGVFVLVIDLAFAACLIWFGPWALVAVWPTSQLPRGSLRAAAARVHEQTGVGFSSMRLLRLPGGAANAMVAGFLPGGRVLLLSDGAARHLSVGLLEAVFAHEAAHIQRRHTLWIALAAGGAFMLAWQGSGATGLGLFAGLGSVLIGVGCAVGVFGFVSRAFEREADALAAQTVSALRAQAPAGRAAGPISADGVASVAALLCAIAELSGMGLNRFGYRHGTLGRRIESVRQAEGGTAAQSRAGAVARQWRRLALVLAVAGGACTAWSFTSDRDAELFSRDIPSLATSSRGAT